MPRAAASRLPSATDRCRHVCRHRAPGFTLIELLVALAIVAVIGVIAFTGLNNALQQEQIVRERSERWREIQLAMRIIVQDLAQIHPRPIRDESGVPNYHPAVVASPLAQFPLELSRGGWSNPAGLVRGTVLRVAYDIEDDVLVRYYWPVLDRTVSTLPLRSELLHGVGLVEFRFLDAAGEWQIEWPPIDQQGQQQLIARPRAIEIAVELEGFGRVWRLVETTG